jgi:hypothetical protein
MSGLEAKFNSLNDNDFIKYAESALASAAEKGQPFPERILVYLSNPDLMIYDPVHITGRTLSKELEFGEKQSLVVTIGMS